MTRVLRPEQPGALAEAARILRAGGLVAFPTETVYGLGADAFDATAVTRIFEAKRRPAFDPLIVHLPEASWLPRVAANLPAAAQGLAARFWPGPLTLVLPRAEAVPDIVTSGLPSVAVRVPDHPAARALIAAAGTPVAAPSANPFGYVSPTTAAHVAELLGDAVDLILDGGPCRVGVESTIVSLLEPTPALLRPGGVPREELEELLGQRLRVVPAGDRPQAPGQLTRHYATRTPLVVLAPEQPSVVPGAGRVGLLAREQAPAAGGFAAIEVLAADGQPRTAAARLFSALRRLDGLGLDLILAEPWPEHGLGLAIMDRLRRCAAGRDD